MRDSDPATGASYERSFVLPRDLATLAEAVEQVDARLVVIDPLMAYLDPSVNSFRDQDARATLAPLARLAGQLGFAALILRHLNKSNGGNALYRGGGSIGIIGAARSGLLAARDPDDPEHARVLASSKSNLGPPMPSLRYRLTVESGHEHPRIEWVGACDYSASALLAASAEGSAEAEKPGALEEAMGWLRETLANGPRKGAEVKREAAMTGISSATLRRARERICAPPDRGGFAETGHTLWALRADLGLAAEE